MPAGQPVAAGGRGGRAQRGQVDADQRPGRLPGVPVLAAATGAKFSTRKLVEKVQAEKADEITYSYLDMP